MTHTSLIAGGSQVHETAEASQQGIPLGRGELILVVDDETAIRGYRPTGSSVPRLSR